MKSASKLIFLITATALLAVQTGVSRGLKVRNYSEIVPASETLPETKSQNPTGATRSLHWQNPDGWKPGSASGMRLGSFQIGSEAECSIIVLGSSAGSLEANVKRWIQQVGINNLENSAMQAFMKGIYDVRAKDGIVFKVVDITQLSREGASTIGSIATLPDKTLFVKLTGPLETLKTLKDPFVELLKSFHYSQPVDPHAGHKAAQPQAESKPSLVWANPKAWKEVPASGMRLVAFVPEAVDGTECYITIMSGDAGGLSRNIQWWGGQLGISLAQDQLQDFIDQLKNVEADNISYLVVDYGKLVLDPSANSMIVAVGSLQNKTVFVKMTGSKQNIEINRGSFMELVTSLRQP